MTERVVDPRAEATDTIQWVADFRAGQFTPASTPDGWSVGMYGLADSADLLAKALLELLSHHGEPSSLDEINEKHSGMPRSTIGEPHRVYKQKHEAECYICTLLTRVGELEDGLRDAIVHLERADLIRTRMMVAVSFFSADQYDTFLIHTADIDAKIRALAPVKELKLGPGCERHKGDPHNLCRSCWELEP